MRNQLSFIVLLCGLMYWMDGLLEREWEWEWGFRGDGVDVENWWCRRLVVVGGREGGRRGEVAVEVAEKKDFFSGFTGSFF